MFIFGRDGNNAQGYNQTLVHEPLSGAGRQDAGQNDQDGRAPPERASAIVANQCNKSNYFARRGRTLQQGR